MERLRYKRYQMAGQTVYKRTCPNGLDIFYIPKKGFTEMTAMLTVDMGALDSQYIFNRRTRYLPVGIAHFLEHQLFLDQDQEDISLFFTKLGADSNAYTTFERTSYFFSTTESLIESVQLLQELVGKAFFTEESITREKEIIKQEISMYQDDSDFQLYKGILANLYPHSLMAEDVAGSEDSVETVCYDDMKRAYDLFYHPTNMTLVIVGDFDHKKLDKALLLSQSAFENTDNVVYKKKELSLQSVIPKKSISMDVVKSKLGLGFRGKPIRRGSIIKQKLALRLFLNMLFGWTSNHYQKWYDSNKIDDSFDFDIEVSSRYQFVMLTLDTEEPIAMSSRIRKVLKNAFDSNEFTEENLFLLKNEIYGEFIRSLDSIDDISHQFVTYLSSHETYFDLPKILNRLTLDEICHIGLQFFDQASVTEFTIFPK